MKISIRLFCSISRRRVQRTVSHRFARIVQNAHRRAKKAQADRHHPNAMPTQSRTPGCGLNAREPFGSIAVPRSPIQNA
jgi:hypothetical protein